MDSGLGEQTILITGASGGIGQATARRLASEGARLGLHYHSNEAGANTLASRLDGQHMTIQADLRVESEVDRLFVESLDELGWLDGIVINAGIWPSTVELIDQMSLERWNETLLADLTSAFLTCRAFFRHLRDQPREEASIVLISSTAGLFGEAGHTDYAAAKSAMAHGLTLSLKNEIIQLAPRGRVNCVCPGWTRTPMAEPGLRDQAHVERVLSTAALKKVATADDIAAAIVFFLSSKLSGHVTGSILPIAGGMEGRRLD